ncbi:hypothetical protein [Lactococcus lactis]|uniref:hypothetical protein n=1 Tax=Lactococcus lactis TaxID=1358 RepID=UPI003DA7D062
MTTTTRIFGNALRNFDQEKPFKISVSNLNTVSHQNVGQLEKEELVSPLDFIENLRRDNHLSEDEAYLAVAELPTREKMYLVMQLMFLQFLPQLLLLLQ